MEFVTFHVALGPERAVHPKETLKHREYLSMIGMMFASARLFHPRARTVVISDQETVFEGENRGITSVARFPMDAARLMLERAVAQLKYVQGSSFEHPIVALDSDILVNGSLDDLFERDFDVAVTWRPSPTQPVNGGLLILNNRRPELARRFFERYVAIYQERYADQAAWYGDQLALRDAVGLDLNGYRSRDIVEVEGCRILLLPCDTYNFSPENGYGQITTPLTDKRILHFKGERKRLMRPFWRAWLRARTSYAPWLQLAAWRERHWLRRQAQQELPGAVRAVEEDA